MLAMVLAGRITTIPEVRNGKYFTKSFIHKPSLVFLPFRIMLLMIEFNLFESYQENFTSPFYFVHEAVKENLDSWWSVVYNLQHVYIHALSISKTITITPESGVTSYSYPLLQ
jgi:hypothetical protein